MAAPASSDSLVACVGFLDSRGSPLYVRTFGGAAGGEEAAKLHSAIFAGVDVLTERVRMERPPVLPARSAAPSAATADPFLGLLCTVEEWKVFGSASNSGLRVVAVIRDVLLREDAVRDLFKRLQALWIDAVCNPFAPLDGRVVSPGFEEATQRLVAVASSSLMYLGPLPF